MSYEIIQLVEVWNDGKDDPVPHLCAKFYLTKKELFMPDKFNELLTGNKTARVRREISETIGGPGYSSVKVSTSIEVLCDQSDLMIKKAADVCLAEASILNEEGVTKAYDGLLKHRKQLGLDG